VKIGVLLLFDGRPGRTLQDCMRRAKEVEDIGFSSLWLPDHVVTFGHYTSTYPYGHDGQPPFGRRQGWYDPLFALAAAATTTSTLRLGTSVLILPQRNPVVLAQEVAALDHLCGGRFDLGVGIGWSREEYTALGVPFEKRGARADEYISAMTCLWRDELATYAGEFVAFHEAVALPKPLQQPRPPLIVGGQSPGALRRAARLGDGWISWDLPADAVPPTVRTLEAECEAAGRDPASFRRLLAFFYTSPDSLVRYIDVARRHGISEVVVAPLAHGRDERHLIDEIAATLGLPSS
jgi:probable F420-dependent oxidoreductase